TKIANLLLVLDTCSSAHGAGEAVTAALENLRRDQESAGVAFLASAQPAQSARASALVDLLTAAVEGLSTAGDKPASLALGTLVAYRNASAQRPDGQCIEWHAAKLQGRVPLFFPNPRRRLVAQDVDVAVRQIQEWQEQAERRDTELVRRMLVRAMA